MTPRRAVTAAVLILTALLLQVAALARLPLPGAAPDLLVVLVVAWGLAGGEAAGAATGFAAGLAADLVSDHALGRLALAYAVAGALAGRTRGRPDRSVLAPVAVAVAAAAGAVLLFAAEGVVLGDPRVTGPALGRSLLSAAGYAAVLTPLVVPAVAALLPAGAVPRRRAAP